MANDLLVVLVHGWSVTSLETYGGFAQQLERQASANGLALQVRDVWLGEYISFRDEVRMPDLVRAFDRALEMAIGSELRRGAKFACITHSTGGPVVRSWWHKHYLFGRRRSCPMSHFIMLAPANFGSALAQLGKSALGRMGALVKGVQPGTGILNWLELGSAGAWALNEEWIRGDDPFCEGQTYPFVLTGQTIDRRLYDHINTYTGEMGSDGVVRMAAANLNASYVRIEQQDLRERTAEVPERLRIQVTEVEDSPRTAFAVVEGTSHSGEDMGIMRSVVDGQPHKTIDLVLQCLSVDSATAYRSVLRSFAAHNGVFATERLFFHDQCSMVILRLRDQEGFAIDDFRLLFTAGGDPNQLPEHFLVDRQKNRLAANTLSLYLNHDVMSGQNGHVVDRETGAVVREGFRKPARLGVEISPEPSEGFARYVMGSLDARTNFLTKAIKPNQTTLVDIVMRRLVRATAFELNKPDPTRPTSFKDREPGGEVLT